MRGRAHVALIRPFTLLAPAIGSLAGAWAASSATRLSADVHALGFGVLSALLATAASNVWNQVYDVDLDRINKPDRPIPRGRISRERALLVGHGYAALALVAGALATWAFFACVALGLLATWVYSAPPVRTKRHPFGSLLTIAFARGLLVPIAGWSLIADPRGTSDPWALGAICGLFVLGAAATKDFADVEGDRTHGCRTLPVILGPRRAARLIAPFLVLPFALYPVAGALGLLHPDSRTALSVLSALLAVGGLLTARLLVRDPAALAREGANHPAWRAMYLLMIGLHVGVGVVYAAPGPAVA